MPFIPQILKNYKGKKLYFMLSIPEIALMIIDLIKFFFSDYLDENICNTIRFLIITFEIISNRYIKYVYIVYYMERIRI